MPTITTNYNKIPLATLKDIRANGYRSKDARRDYYPHLIERAIQTQSYNASERELDKRAREEIQYLNEMGE